MKNTSNDEERVGCDDAHLLGSSGFLTGGGRYGAIGPAWTWPNNRKRARTSDGGAQQHLDSAGPWDTVASWGKSAFNSLPFVNVGKAIAGIAHGENVGKVLKKAAVRQFLPIVGERVLNAVEHMDSMPPDLREFINKYPQATILKIRVGRTPLAPAIRKTLEAASPAVAREWKGRLIYHVYQYILLDLGTASATPKWIRLDKNEKVALSFYTPGLAGSKGEELMSVDTVVPGSVSLRDYIDKGYAFHPQSFFQYNAISANCQLFVLWCLEGNGFIDPADEEDNALYKFIYQKVVVPPALKSFMAGVTNLANVGRGVLFGTNGPFGKSRKRSRC